jgi:hypothetical protein
VWPGSEPLGHRIDGFLSWLTTSDYWTGTLAEYGVGAGRNLGVIVLPTPAPAQMGDADIRNAIMQLVQSGTVTVDDNTQLMFVLPSTTTLGSGDFQSCVYFAGYHESHVIGMQHIAYDVIADCNPTETELDSLTSTISHETAETATDPVPNTGWAAEPPVPQEISDLCNFNSHIGYDVPGVGDAPPIRYWVQRQYSATVAAAGNDDPCRPLPWTRPFWSVALYPSTLRAKTSAQPVTLQAWLEPFAYGDVGLIKWIAAPVDDNIIIEPAQGQSHAGDTIPVTITLTAPMSAGVHEIDVESQAANGGSSWWFGYVVINK